MDGLIDMDGQFDIHINGEWIDIILHEWVDEYIAKHMNAWGNWNHKFYKISPLPISF